MSFQEVSVCPRDLSTELKRSRCCLLVIGYRVSREAKPCRLQGSHDRYPWAHMVCGCTVKQKRTATATAELVMGDDARLGGIRVTRYELFRQVDHGGGRGGDEQSFETCGTREKKRREKEG